ncbi:hypothetical protein SK128_017124 [Halocaridina rubra]|uniref:Uncharacterized protein n=1 Tax=Halocaridina rubra TaxID=373956 RepID=A0AAN9A0I2_HALRR
MRHYSEQMEEEKEEGGGGGEMGEGGGARSSRMRITRKECMKVRVGNGMRKKMEPLEKEHESISIERSEEEKKKKLAGIISGSSGEEKEKQRQCKGRLNNEILTSENESAFSHIQRLQLSKLLFHFRV